MLAAPIGDEPGDPAAPPNASYPQDQINLHTPDLPSPQLASPDSVAPDSTSFISIDNVPMDRTEELMMAPQAPKPTPIGIIQASASATTPINPTQDLDNTSTHEPSANAEPLPIIPDIPSETLPDPQLPDLPDLSLPISPNIPVLTLLEIPVPTIPDMPLATMQNLPLLTPPDLPLPTSPGFMSPTTPNNPLPTITAIPSPTVPKFVLPSMPDSPPNPHSESLQTISLAEVQFEPMALVSLSHILSSPTDTTL